MHAPDRSLEANRRVARRNRIGPGARADQRDAARRNQSTNITRHAAHRRFSSILRELKALAASASGDNFSVSSLLNTSGGKEALAGLSP